jgi:hypothetical protein
MTKITLTKEIHCIKSILGRSAKKQHYLKSLETAYIQQAFELQRMKNLLAYRL